VRLVLLMVCLAATPSAPLGKLPHLVTPIAVPLADGLTASDLEALDARVTFDVDGSGLDREWSWITPKAAWLVSDPKLDGKINSGRQLFGNVTFWMFWNNGYAPLAALDDDRNGILTGKELAGLALWRDANSNGVADPGEVKPVSAYGIVAISSKWQTLDKNPDKVAFSPNGVVFQDGTTRPSFDLVLKAQLGFQATFRAPMGRGTASKLLERRFVVRLTRNGFAEPVTAASPNT